MELDFEKMKKSGEVFDFITKTLKVVGIVGSVCGSMYFLYYTTAAGIPFPLELNVLATALLYIGILSLTGSFVLVLGTLVPALFTDSFPRKITEYFRAADKGHSLGHIVLRYLVWSWIPLAMLISAIFVGYGALGPKEHSVVTWVGLVVSALAMIFAAPLWMKASRGEFGRYVLIKSLQTFFSTFSFAITVILAVIVFPEMKQLAEAEGSAAVLLVFTVIHFLVVAPNITKINRTTGGNVGAALLTKPRTIPATTLAMIIAAIATAYPLLIPQVGAKVGEIALRGLRTGGGIKLILCTKTRPQEAVLAQIEFDADNCSKAPVHLVLDIGERVYVAKTWPISWLQEKPSDKAAPVYFRQDEIRQKIYVRANKDA